MSTTAFDHAAQLSEAATGKRSFIVRLWLDSDPAGSAHRSWRGHVTSVADGERVYASEPDEVPTLLARQMDRSGIRLGWRWRLRLALYGWKAERRNRK